mgnify:CR=1 FL=1
MSIDTEMLEQLTTRQQQPGRLVCPAQKNAGLNEGKNRAGSRYFKSTINVTTEGGY